jgi:hypothetical protein
MRWAALAITGLVVVKGGLMARRWWRFAQPELQEAVGKLAEARALSNMLTLVPDPASDPAISPDGNSVAFRRNSYAPGAAGIFVTGSNGKALTQLTQHPGDCCPAWSPDGKSISFCESPRTIRNYVVNATEACREDFSKIRGRNAVSGLDGWKVYCTGGCRRAVLQYSCYRSGLIGATMTDPQGRTAIGGRRFRRMERGWRSCVNGADTGRNLRDDDNGRGRRWLQTSQAEKEATSHLCDTGKRDSAPGDQSARPSWGRRRGGGWGKHYFSSTKAGEPSLWRISNGARQFCRTNRHCHVASSDFAGRQQLVVRKFWSSGIYRVDLEKATPSVTNHCDLHEWAK